MYRYTVDNAVTYSPEDLALFRESPFASWMERLTLENPDHGIPPDINGIEPQEVLERQDDIVVTLRAEGRNVSLIDGELEEPARRAATLSAMRSGVDFIVNGQLALGPLSGKANLLMRTSGYSELGDFLYTPCDSRVRTVLDSAFHLCFMADLLYNLQGQLPPQMLVICADGDVQPLQTEDHIYYFRAMKQRFMDAMGSFRKHKMPDPAESSHFGRWSECASEVLKQRAQREEMVAQAQQESAESQGEGAEPQEESAEPQEVQLVAAAGGAGPVYNLEEAFPTAVGVAAARSGPGLTLAEQASSLPAGGYKIGKGPGHTPNLARYGKLRSVELVSDQPEQDGEQDADDGDAALQNLEFIGSGPEVSVVSAEQAVPYAAQPPQPALREAPGPESVAPVEEKIGANGTSLPDLEPPAPFLLPPEDAPSPESAREVGKPHPLDSNGPSVHPDSVVDMDSAPPPTLSPVVERAEVEMKRRTPNDPLVRRPVKLWDSVDEEEEEKEEKTPPVGSFSDSLITGDKFDDL